MSAESTLRSPYQIRLELVEEAVKKNSSLDEAAARELAVQVLHALNSIPETVR